MKFLLFSSLLLAACSSASFGQVVINEIRINDPDADDFEYFELFNRGQSAINLDTICYIVIGMGPGGSGVVQQAHNLPPIFLNPGSHYLVSKHAMLRVDSNSDGIADTTATPDLVLPLDFEDSSNVTHLLAVGFTGAVGGDLDADDDGILDANTWVGVLDAVSFYAPGNDSLPYATAINATFENAGPDGESVPSHLFRVPDGGAWIVGALGQEHDPGTGNLLQNSSDTPGFDNPTVTPLLFSLSSESVSEGDSNPALTGTVTRPGTSGEVELTVTISDQSEATIPTPVVLPAGEATVEFEIHVVNDRYPDGAQTVTVTVSGPGFGSAEKTFQVTDDGDAFSLVFNEVYYVNDPVSGDANGDTFVDAADQFVEIVNVGAAPIDMSGYHMEDRSGTELNADGIHRFPPGTILYPGCAIVVFGGEGAVAGTTTAFGTSEVQISSSNGLALDESGDTLRLLDDSGIEVYSLELPDLSSAPVKASLNLISEGAHGFPALGYDLYPNLSVGGDGSFSPGVALDHDPFCRVTDSLSITLLESSLLTPRASIPEDAPPGSVVARVSAPGRVAGEVVSFRIASALGELVPAGDGTGILDDTNPTVDLLLDAVDNALAQGSRLETISVSASRYLNSESTIEILDDGDLPPFTEVVINEVDADQAGGDNQEFVELYNLTGLDRSMDGLVLVLINGSGDSVYHVTDLSGFVIPAHGFFVVGHDTVPNVDLVPPGLSIQNGADAVAIYRGTATDFAPGVEVTSITNILVDAVVYDTNDGEDAGLIAALTPGQPQINESGGAGSGTESIQRDPDGGAQLETSSFVTRSPTPGRSNQLPPDERLVDLDFDFAGKLLVATVSDLRPGTTYTMEASSDAGDTDPFVPITSFTAEDRNVIAVEGTLFQVYIIDGFLADLVANPKQVYRLRKP